MPKMGPIAQWLRLKFIMETCPHYKTRDPHPHASTLRSTTLRLKFSSYWGVWGGWISLCNSTLWGMCWVSLFPFFSVEQQFQLNWDHVKNQAMTLGQNAAPRCPPPTFFRVEDFIEQVCPMTRCQSPKVSPWDFPISLQSDFARAALGSVIVSSELT